MKDIKEYTIEELKQEIENRQNKQNKTAVEFLRLHTLWLKDPENNEKPKGKDFDLRGADLKGAILEWANLKGADLRGADLRGADLRGADLKGANLEWANLKGADLKGADLKGANLELATIELYDSDVEALAPYLIKKLKELGKLGE